MAQVAGTYDTYDVNGIREDLIDEITNISPTDTPFVSMSKRGKCSSTTHTFQTDAIAAGAANAVVDGNETSFSDPTATTTLTNYTQILEEQIQVSGSTEVVNKAGRKSELAYQLGLKIKKLAKDLDFACLQNATAVAGNSSTARQLKGVDGWLTTNQTDKVATALVQDDIDTILQNIWTQGGNPSVIFCGAFNKKKIAGFATGVTKNLDANDKRLVNNVDIYEGPFGGLQRVYPEHQILADNVDILDMDLWRICVLRPVTVHKIAKVGDTTRRMINMEVTLESRQEKGSGQIINTTTA